MAFPTAWAPLRWAVRFPVTLSYVAGLLPVAFFQATLSDARNAQLVSDASTNLSNLAKGKAMTLLESAFVTQADPDRLWVWLPGLACLLALGELLWRPRRLAGAVVLGHVGGTMLVAAGLVVALRLGWVSSSVADDDDVGVSYATMGVIGALVGALPRALRPPWAAWWLALAGVAAWADRDFTSVGHLVSLALGLAAGAWRSRSDGARWTPASIGLCAVAVAVAAGVLVDGFGGQTLAVLLAGAAAAALAAGVTPAGRGPGSRR